MMDDYRATPLPDDQRADLLAKLAALDAEAAPHREALKPIDAQAKPFRDALRRIDERRNCLLEYFQVEDEGGCEFCDIQLFSGDGGIRTSDGHGCPKCLSPEAA